MIPIGAHVPMAGGLGCALHYARDTGCEAMQIFPKSPRRWAGPALDPAAADAFREDVRATSFGPVFTHASYLINLGSDNDELWEKSSVALADELIRGCQVGASGVVVHLGRRFSDDETECIGRVAACVLAAAGIAGERAARVLLENSAGAGRQFGCSVAEMAAALNAVRNVGVDAALCFDTCHGFASGIDIRTGEGWAAALSELDSLCGPGAVALIHANDCKGEIGSHKDRHDWIGDGLIGLDAFEAMFAQPGLFGAAVVVEMPGDGPHKDEENVRRLKALRDGDAASVARGPEPA